MMIARRVEKDSEERSRIGPASDIASADHSRRGPRPEADAFTDNLCDLAACRCDLCCRNIGRDGLDVKPRAVLLDVHRGNVCAIQGGVRGRIHMYACHDPLPGGRRRCDRQRAYQS
jgi:hypothetical protein